MAFTFQENDILCAMYPLMLASTVFGLAPLGYKKIGGKQKMYFSTWSLASTMMLLTVNIAMIICIMTTMDPPRNILCKIRLYEDVFSSLLYICELVMGCIHAKKILEIFNNIEEADRALRRLGIRALYRKLYIYVAVIILFTCSMLSTVFMMFSKKPSFVLCYKPQVYRIPLLIFAFLIPYVGNLLMELQYFYLLHILRDRFKKLNRYLSRNGGKEIRRKDVSNPKAITVAPKTQINLDSVTQLALVHMKLTDTARLINRAFDFQQLMKITISFVSTIIALFLFTTVFTAGEDQKIDVDLFFVSWAFSNVVEVFAVVWISSEICEEANSSAIILQRMRTEDKDLARLIDLYSLQMHHTKITFTICGLFPLNYSLLYMIVAGTITYLVILIQFNLDIVRSSANDTYLLH